ncbi:hypothetical protein RAA17_03860 [Komagataeibacter rhaeticus]|nr:hypothetical protein [Komagataeibacter rhaeticus]
MAAAAPAAHAQPFRGGREWHGGPPPGRGGWHDGRRGGGAGLAVGSGLAGLAVGAMLGSAMAERGAVAPRPPITPRRPAPAAAGLLPVWWWLLSARRQPAPLPPISRQGHYTS